MDVEKRRKKKAYIMLLLSQTSPDQIVVSHSEDTLSRDNVIFTYIIRQPFARILIFFSLIVYWILLSWSPVRGQQTEIIIISCFNTWRQIRIIIRRVFVSRTDHRRSAAPSRRRSILLHTPDTRMVRRTMKKTHCSTALRLYTSHESHRYYYY